MTDGILEPSTCNTLLLAALETVRITRHQETMIM